MIEFQNVAISNFLSIQSAIVNLDNQGLVLIEGVNEDDPSALSNGAGKSSIVDAISWCLYGVTARGVTGDSVVNVKAGKDTRVHMMLVVDGVQYSLVRHRKHSKEKNRINLFRVEPSGEIDQTLGTDKLTQERINNLLGCDAQVFNAAIYMGQENMPDLPMMTDKALKTILEQAMGLDKLDVAMEIVTDRIKTTESDLKDGRISEHSITTEQAADADSIRTLKGIIDIYEADIKTTKEQMLEMKASYRLMDMGFAASLKSFADELADVINQPDDPTLEATRDKSLDAIKPQSEVIDGLRKELESLRVNRRLQQTELEACNNTECPTCKRPHDNAADLLDKAKRIKVEQRKTDASIDKLAAKIDSLTKKRDASIAKVMEIYTAAKATAASKRSDTTIKKDINRVMVDRAAARDGFFKSYDRLKVQLSGKTDLIADATKKIKTLEDELRVGENLLVNLTTKIKQLESKLNTLMKVKYALGRKGFRGEVLDQVTPYLNARTQKYLSALTDDNITATWNTITENSDGDYVENFHITVDHKSGVNKFGLLSGGEKRKVRLACALALQDLVATRAIKPIKLFIADEIDDAIDAAGLERLMGILETKAKEVGTVYVISHNEIGDWVRNKLTVTKHDGVSAIT